MTLYRWNKDLRKFVDKKTGELMPIADENAICKPMIISDIEDYVSPVCGPDGKHEVVGGRAGQKEDLKKNNCYLMDPPKGDHGTTRGFRKPENAPSGKTSEEAQWRGQQRQKAHAERKPFKETVARPK